MIVTLLSHTKDPEQVVAAAIRQCYASIGSKELKKKIDKETRERLIKQVIASGHTSTLEHASFTFGVEGVSRITEIQLIRHRVGTAYSIQSGRRRHPPPRGPREAERMGCRSRATPSSLRRWAS